MTCGGQRRAGLPRVRCRTVAHRSVFDPAQPSHLPPAPPARHTKTQDWGNKCGGGASLRPYLSYFQAVRNQSVYDVRIGPDLHFFMLDSDCNEPLGRGPASKQAEWLRAKLAASDAPLKARARARAGKGRGGWGGPRRRLAHRVRAAACSQTSKPCAPPYPLSQVYLKRNKLALGGKKQELIDRIKEHVLSGIA